MLSLTQLMTVSTVAFPSALIAAPHVPLQPVEVPTMTHSESSAQLVASATASEIAPPTLALMLPQLASMHSAPSTLP